MSPALLLAVLLAALLALLPVWRLRVAGWPTRWLVAAWLVLTLGMLVALRLPAVGRFLLPILVVLFLAPFVAGPERVTRVLRARPGVVVNVTPRPALRPPELPAGREDTTEADDETGPAARRDPNRPT